MVRATLRIRSSELVDRLHDLRDLLRGVCARIAGERDDVADWPDMDCEMREVDHDASCVVSSADNLSQVKLSKRRYDLCSARGRDSDEVGGRTVAGPPST